MNELIKLMDISQVNGIDPKSTNIYSYGSIRLLEVPETGMGDLSDGYHTFNELYHHRAILFMVVCKCFKQLAWKSKLHSDGTMFENMFIVGINTPDGQATYHYDIDPYWGLFDVKELDIAPEFDGHTPNDAINRISKLNIDDYLELHSNHGY